MNDPRPAVLFLGASPQQLAPLAYARSAGYRLVTCDNRPDNPGHRLADAWHEVSTLDRDGVLEVARAERVDGIVCYASDVSAPTAAFVAGQLGLPANPVASVELLTDKARFRAWQRHEGFFVPDHLAIEAGELDDPNLPARILRRIAPPLVVKPTDASGGKGISIVRDAAGLAPALASAAAASRGGTIVAEAFVERLGHQVCGEGFLVDGRIAFVAFADEHFTPGLHVPVGETFPGSHSDADVARGTAVLQAIFSRLGMRRGPFNFDLFFVAGHEPFVVEIGPRNGGNRMPEAVHLAYGVDLAGATVEAALGRPVAFSPTPPRCRATYSVHSRVDGVLERIDYAPELEPHILDRAHYVAPGEPVQRFRMGSLMLGNLLLGFDSPAAMLATMARMDELVRVTVHGEAQAR
jgi:biotin carboxylase